jgi:archaemetzincin
VLTPWPEPDYAHLPGRNQYDAAKILSALSEGQDLTKVRVGLTALDIALPILTYVFGESVVEGRVAVVSYFRLRHEPGGRLVGLERFYERLGKVVLHEAAHALGLPHCRGKKCILRFSYDLAQLDSLEPAFCPNCERALPLRKTWLKSSSEPH